MHWKIDCHQRSSKLDYGVWEYEQSCELAHGMPRSFLSRALVALQRIVVVLTLRGSDTENNATKRVNQGVIAIYAAANEYLPT